MNGKSTACYSLADAERALTLPKTWWAWATVLPFAKRLSVYISNKTAITPNQITSVSFLLVIIASGFFYQGSHAALIAGALFYQLNYLLDCVDGTVARLKNKCSIEGCFFDFFSDHWKNFIALIALSYGQFIRYGDERILLASIAFIFLDQIYLLRDVKAETILNKSHILFFTAPSRFVNGIPFAGRIMGWMSRHKLYSRPTIVDIWMIVFIAGPLFNNVTAGITAGALLLFIVFIHQTIRFLINGKRSRSVIERLKSHQVGSIAIFGTGAMARRFYDWSDEEEISGKIIYAFDNDSSRWGRPGFVPAVVSPERLRRREFNILIVASQHGYHEIVYQLQRMNLRPWKDFVALAYI